DCGGANEKVHAISELAQTAWYSASPVTKIHHAVEYRKHPEHDRYFHFKQYDRYGVHVEVRVLTKDNTTTDITVHPYPSNVNNELDSKHRKLVNQADAIVYTNKSHHTTFLGEHFVTKDDRTNRYYHKCFDGSVKELYDPPDPFRSGTHPGATKLEIFLSPRSTSFKGNNVDIIHTLSQAFQDNVGLPDPAARHAAFWHLKEIIEKRRSEHWHLNPFTAQVAGRTAVNNWYQYVANSSRLFRETEGGGLEEYHRDTKLVSPIVDPGVEVQASLSRRKARMYGFASNALEDRF
ncbi:hypothetical protein JCM5353_005394, partial [Sporobolomyces roseus]